MAPLCAPPNSAVVYRFARPDPGGRIAKQSSKNGPARKVKICKVTRLSIGAATLILD
jgi:hypothetical protein